MKEHSNPSVPFFGALALSLALFWTSAGAADGVTTEDALRAAVAGGGTVTLGGNISLTTKLTADKVLTIDGTDSQYSLTYSGEGEAIATQNNAAFTLKNVNLQSTAANGRGIGTYGSAPVLTVDNCTLSVGKNGISMMSGDIPATTGASITVKNSTIQNNRKPSDLTYDTWAAVADTRGISVYNAKAASIAVQDSAIEGFGYCINVTGTRNSDNIVDTEGTAFTVTNSHLKGWTTFNVWGARSTYNITNTELLGINVATGGSNSFSTIVVNDDIYDQFDSLHAEANEFTITGGSIQNYVSAAAQAANMAEQLIRIDRDGITKLHFAKDVRKNVAIKDTADCCESVLYSPVRTPAEMQEYFTGDRFSGDEFCTAVKSDGTTVLPFIPAV